MKKVITSFGVGEHSTLLSLAIPTFYLYAHNHNYDVFIPSDSFFNEQTRTMHPSWWKIDVIEHLLQTYDKVLWLDADIILCRFDKDIIDELDNSSDFGLVVHETSDGQVPNCGVWLLNKSSLKWLSTLKQYNHFLRSQCWWEQAALLHLLGINPDDNPIVLPSTYNISWNQLDYLWNPHINDHRKIPPETKFFHTTCFNDRYVAMKSVLQQINI